MIGEEGGKVTFNIWIVDQNILEHIRMFKVVLHVEPHPELVVVQPDVVSVVVVVLLDDEQLAVAGQDDVHLPLHHVHAHADVDVHELGLDGKEGHLAGQYWSVKSAKVGLVNGSIIIQTIVTVYHHCSVAMVTLSRVTNEILVTLGALMLPTLLGLTIGDGRLRDGVVTTRAAHPRQRMTRVSVSVTVALLTRLPQ